MAAVTTWLMLCFIFFSKNQVALLAVLSIAGYILTLRMIPIVAAFCRDKGELFGRDINKVISDKMCASCDTQRLFLPSLSYSL